MMHSQVLCWTQVGSKSVKQQNCLEPGARSQLSALKGVEGRAKVSGWDSEEGRALVTYSNLHPKPTNKLVSSHSRAPLVLRQTMGNFGLIRTTTAQTQGKPPPSPI
jgi:hypothetical protein